MPIVTERLQKPVLDSITKIISSGTWNEGAKNELLNLVSEYSADFNKVIEGKMVKVDFEDSLKTTISILQ